MVVVCTSLSPYKSSHPDVLKHQLEALSGYLGARLELAWFQGVLRQPELSKMAPASTWHCCRSKCSLVRSRRSWELEDGCNLGLASGATHMIVICAAAALRVMPHSSLAFAPAVGNSQPAQKLL